MPKLPRQVGTTSQIVLVTAYDTQSTNGGGKTGLANTSMTAYYKRNTGTASVSCTVNSITTLGTYAGSATAAAWKEVDSTNMVGLYELHLPNNMLVSGADEAVMYVTATGIVPVKVDIELTATSNQDGVRMGMTALPNAAAGASGGLGTVDSTNSIKIQTAIKKNVAFSNFRFQMLDASTGNPAGGLTVAGQYCLDAAGSFSNLFNAVSAVASGWYTVNLIAGETNGTVLCLRFSASGAKDTDLIIFPQP